jgi:hypothetical protein
MVGIMFSTEGFQRFGVRIHTYVLMPNNYHLQLELGSRLSLSAAMHGLNTGYGIWFKRRYRGQGALFQGWFEICGQTFRGGQLGRDRPAMEKEWGRPWAELRTSRDNNARTIAIWFARRRAGMKLEQVREQLQARSYIAVAMQMGRLKRQLPHQPKLGKRLCAAPKRPMLRRVPYAMSFRHDPQIRPLNCTPRLRG